MPYLDAFEIIDIVEHDINNEEDNFLIDHPNWDYDPN